MKAAISTSLHVIGSLGLRAVVAQQLAYTTFPVTECTTQAHPTSSTVGLRLHGPPINNNEPGEKSDPIPFGPSIPYDPEKPYGPNDPSEPDRPNDRGGPNSTDDDDDPNGEDRLNKPYDPHKPNKPNDPSQPNSPNSPNSPYGPNNLDDHDDTNGEDDPEMPNSEDLDDPSTPKHPYGPINLDSPSNNNRQPQNPIRTISYSMPPCPSCDCPTCTLLSTFTTCFPAFHTLPTAAADRPHAVFAEQMYAVTETYRGLSSLPRFQNPTAVPFAFAVQVVTCEAGRCAEGSGAALTATLTFPSGGSPFAAGTDSGVTSGDGDGDGIQQGGSDPGDPTPQPTGVGIGSPGLVFPPGEGGHGPASPAEGPSVPPTQTPAPGSCTGGPGHDGCLTWSTQYTGGGGENNLQTAAVQSSTDTAAAPTGVGCLDKISYGLLGLVAVVMFVL